MKKLFLVFFLFSTGIINSVFAQETHFGIKAGGNYSTLGGDAEKDSKFRFGYHGGLFVSLGISENYSLQPEILYSFQGAADDDNSDKLKVFTNLSYLSIPILGKIYVTDAFNIKFGPQVGFLLGAKQRTKGELLGADVDKKDDVKDSFKTLDYGVVVDLGYELAPGPGIGLRYNLGLGNINDVNDNTATNQVIQAYLSYSF